MGEFGILLFEENVNVQKLRYSFRFSSTLLTISL